MSTNNILYDRAVGGMYISDTASEVVQEAVDTFKRDERLNLVGKDFVNEIITDPVLFAKYVTEMTKEMEVGDGELMGDLLENQRTEVLYESMINVVAPIVSMVGPIYRKFLPKLVVKETFPTQTVSSPHFKVRHLTKIYVDIYGVEHDTKDYFKGQFNESPEDFDDGMLPIYKGFLPLDALDEYNPLNGERKDGTTHASTPVAVGTHYTNVLVANGLKNRDTLDRKLSISGVKMELGIGWDYVGGVFDATQNVIVDVDLNILKNHEGTFYGIATFIADSTWANPVPATDTFKAVPAGTVFTDTITGHFEDEAGFLMLTSIKGTLATSAEDDAKVTEVKLNGRVSTELNNTVAEAKPKIKHEEFMIGGGEHLSASLPEEYIRDLNAMYSVDGNLAVADILSDTVARKVEVEAWQFLGQSYATNQFDVRGFFHRFDRSPDASFAASPKQWKEELKEVIDYAAVQIRNENDYPNGKFVIYGNDLDIHMIPNIDWLYQSNSGSETNGVAASFNLGSFRGAGGRYDIVGSSYLPKGQLRIVFYPDRPDIMTYKYFPYSFNVVTDNSYRNPNAPNVPSITMMKRHLFAELTPYQGIIEIKNNNPAGFLSYR